ncbi:MAG TPA: helix-turn-helix transcriptional regulator [Mycobacterium sp.]|uniref:helix-turn-helix transcriptional regulator n=1 Tax=Mycolicibacterium sp. TaxID=2320850 RepID=UPI0025CC3EC5|nr:helix-turn-helix transcriptional regulator [Mycolicibacterium sp.]HPX35467.1 helix-turn-helix transcriptional regulator [Mycobacterium sp.]HQC75403.1 helix-turn-helix transcriptional regulator [Mycobacterium sp.]
MENGGEASPAGGFSTAAAGETWPEYLRRIAGGQTQSQIAERIGIGRLSVCNWLHGKTRPKAETVIMVARVFRRSPIEALLAASYLVAEELNQPIEVRVSPSDLSADDLATEVRRRLVALES